MEASGRHQAAGCALMLKSRLVNSKSIVDLSAIRIEEILTGWRHSASFPHADDASADGRVDQNDRRDVS